MRRSGRRSETGVVAPARESALATVEIRDLTAAETDAAARVLGGGMRDNPLHVRAFGPRPERRELALTRMFEALLRLYLSKGAVLGAFSAGNLVGVCGMVQPNRCQPTAGEKLQLLPALVSGGGLGATARVLRWVAGWARHDPRQAHWHLGPVGVERRLQGKGIGSALLQAFCDRIDATRSVAYLETDKQENVRFYQRFGFCVSAQDLVLGVPSWFMFRAAGQDP
jgi:ribosomal protein S18 acetylase RimI-like enzyme